MLSDFNYENIYIACGYTDLRYGIDGLAATIQEKFELNPFSPHSIFLFCGRRNDRIKALVWEGDGFCCTNDWKPVHFDGRERNLT